MTDRHHKRIMADTILLLTILKVKDLIKFASQNIMLAYYK